MVRVEGLGDLLTFLLKLAGIRIKENCNCDNRRKRLNKMFPFRRRRPVYRGPVDAEQGPDRGSPPPHNVPDRGSVWSRFI